MRAVIFVVSFLSLTAFADAPAYGATPIYGYVNPQYPQDPVDQQPVCPPAQQQACPPIQRCDYEMTPPGEPFPMPGPPPVAAPPAKPRDHSGPDPVIFHWVDENGIDVYSDTVPSGAANKATRIPPETFRYDVDVTFDEPPPEPTTPGETTG